MSKAALSSPWISYARMLYMLFGEDPEINVIYDNDKTEVRLYVNNNEKATALSKKLPVEKTFGNVTLKITIIPNNDEDSSIDIFRKIFNGNPILSDIVTEDGPMQAGMSHILFRNEVVQYFNDCLNDPMGLETTLYEDLARKVFEDTEGVYFNTDVADDSENTIWP